MAERTELIFRIDAFTRETLPMARLAEYMADLAALLGSPERVHFERLEDGSVCLVQSLDEEAEEPVKRRVASAVKKNAPPDVKRAYDALNFRLRDHGATGRIIERESGAEIIGFPGREIPKPLDFGSVSKQGSLDGELLAIGGKGDPVPVHIGEYSACRAKRQMAKELAPYLFSQVRVFGQGRWNRDEDGRWNLGHFAITHFEPLDPSPLSQALSEIRDIGDTSWVQRGLDNLKDIRGDEDK